MSLDVGFHNFPQTKDFKKRKSVTEIWVQDNQMHKLMKQAGP